MIRPLATAYWLSPKLGSTLPQRLGDRGTIFLDDSISKRVGFQVLQKYTTVFIKLARGWEKIYISKGQKTIQFKVF